MQLNWQFQPFNQLSNSELYEILCLRQQVFVVEQNCPYLDADGIDKQSWHLMGWDEASLSLLAYARIVPPGVKYEEPSIGRVITSLAVRGTGLGKVLMKEAIDMVEQLFPESGIRISAQQHLEGFYQAFDFSRVSSPYNEDGIPHVEMLRAIGKLGILHKLG